MGGGASVERLTDDLEGAFARACVWTPRGSLASCNRGEVRAVVKTANARIGDKYKEAWDWYTTGATIGLQKLRQACNELTTACGNVKARCALPEGAGVDTLIEMASRYGAALHAALERVITSAGGEYVHGPQKKADRIAEKAANDYEGDAGRVCDVERATGKFDSVEDLNASISALRGALDGIEVRRCKDLFFAHKHDSGYRDIKFFVEVSGTGFIGELQLNLRRIIQVKDLAHKVYDVDRVLDQGTDEVLRRAVVGLGLESEQVLRLTVDGGSPSIATLSAALNYALPHGCEVANVYVVSKDVFHERLCCRQSVFHVRLSLENIGAMATLRDAILGPSFADALSENRDLAIRVDRGAFVECYARSMMRFNKLTLHQREKLEAVRGTRVAVLLAPAGGGKTFVAVQRVIQMLNENPDATVLFVARNKALALFFCKWLVVASRKSAEHVVERVHVLVAPFSSGPQRVHVEAAGGRRRLVFRETRVDATTYALIVVDEAHHLVDKSSLRSELAELNAAKSSLLFLGDASQATAAMRSPEEIARSLVELPQDQEVVVAMLSEVVRSTKRIVAGAAAFQLEAGRKAETSTHGASAGPPLVARIFKLSEDDDPGEAYALEVVEALAAIRRHLMDLDDLDDRVAVIGPDEAFIERLREPLAHALGGFELVDAATASAALPRGDTKASDGSKQWLVVDSIENMDGLERLVVICVGMDQVIDRGAGVLETRSCLYRAMTRAQLAVAVVNEVVPGGWLEFLGRVELDADGGFDDAAERENLAETAADDVVRAVVKEASAPVRESVGDGDGTAVGKASSAPARDSIDDGDGAQQPSSNDAVYAPVVWKATADADVATTPSEAEPMKVLQTIWDASAVATVALGDLRFMPFYERVDLSKLAELRTLEGHSKPVYGVAGFPDGRRVVSASRDGTLKVWDVATGTCVATLEVGSSVQCVAVFPDGRRVVSASVDNTLKVWDIATGACMTTLQGHSDWVNGVAVFPNGRLVISASRDETLKVWNVATGKCVATLEGHADDVLSVAVFPDGQRVVSASQDNTLMVWDVETRECVATLQGHSDTVMSVAVFPNGRRVVSASGDKTLKVWDVKTGLCVATLQGHSDWVNGVAIFPDGRVVSASQDATLKVWDVATAACVATLEGHSQRVHGIAVFSHGQRVVSGAADKMLKLWGIAPVSVDLSKPAELRGKLNGHSGNVYCVAISPDGRRIVSGSHDKTLKVWDVTTGECVATLEGHSSRVDCVAVLPDGRHVVSGSWDNTLKVWDLATGVCMATLEGHSKRIKSVAVFPDGQRVVSGSKDSTLRVWNVARGTDECMAILGGHSASVKSVAVFPDGLRVVSASSDKTLKVWIVMSNGMCVATLKGHSNFVYSVAVFPDGRRVVSCDGDHNTPGVIKVWDVDTGECVATLEGHSDSVECVAVSPDGRHVVSGSVDNTLKMWDVRTGNCVTTLEGHAGRVNSVAVSPDGLHVVSGSNDKTVQFWVLPKS